MREFLKGLELDKEVINTIMAEYGKQIESYKEKIDEYENQIADYKANEVKSQAELEDYKGQIDTLNKTIEDNTKSLENLQLVTDENKDLKAQIFMGGANVKKEFMKFVKTEVAERVNDETDFEKALADYKKENPQYFGDVVVKKVQTSPELTGGETKPQTTNNIMNDILRGSRN